MREHRLAGSREKNTEEIYMDITRAFRFEVSMYGATVLSMNHQGKQLSPTLVLMAVWRYHRHATNGGGKHPIFASLSTRNNFPIGLLPEKWGSSE